MRPPGLALALLLSPVLAPGCIEMREPPPRPLALPAWIAPAGEGGDPARDMIRDAAEGFADQGRGLAGRPAEAARAVAQLEYLAAVIPAGGRWAPISPSAGFALRGARQELRGALGTREGAPPGAVVEALSTAAAALRGGDRGAAGRALSPRLFNPGGAETLARLGDLGTLPQAAEATALVAREAARLDADRRWFGTAPTDAAVTTGGRAGTFGIGAGVGY